MKKQFSFVTTAAGGIAPRRLTDHEVAEAIQAIKAAEALRKHMRASRGTVSRAPSWEILCEIREGRFQTDE